MLVHGASVTTFAAISMTPKKKSPETKPGISKLKLALGAAGLFLFIVGVKRSFRLDDERVVEDRDMAERADPKPGAGE
jgi:hypothetical protein